MHGLLGGLSELLHIQLIDLCHERSSYLYQRLALPNRLYYPGRTLHLLLSQVPAHLNHYIFYLPLLPILQPHRILLPIS